MSAEGISNAIDTLISHGISENNVVTLAALYDIRDRLSTQNSPPDVTENELDDILPCYRSYKEVKRKYQLGETGKEPVIDSFRLLCSEIREFIQTLFSGTDTPQEREQLKELLKELHQIKMS